MSRFFRYWSLLTATYQRRRFRLWQRYPLAWLFCLSCIGLGLGLTATQVHAQSDPVEQREEQVIREFVLPNTPTQAPVYRPRSTPAPAPRQRSPQRPAPAAQPAPPRARTPARVNEPPAQTRQQPPTQTSQSPTQPPPKPTEVADALPTSQYILEFNRSPVIGNRFRLQGTHAEARLGFTRPRSWKMQSAKALIRFQHSPALLANRSHLTVRVNGTSVGSVPLNRRDSQIGQVLFNIPTTLIQDFNEISVVAQQHNSAECSDPADPTLWTEVLPDSKLLFDFQPQPIALDFSRYPFPFLDNLSLDPDRLAYLRPKELNENWLTTTARFQTAAGRLAEFHRMDTRLVTTLDQVRSDERLILIGTPSEQPALASLSLPFPIQDNQVLDGNNSVLPGDVGVLMLTTIQDNGVPVLVATGNDAAGVAKAVQFLVQSPDRQLGTGQALVVSNLTEVPSPDPRQWPQYLPTQNSFKLSDLSTPQNQSFKDVTVHGAYAPPIRVDFRALPDEQFTRGNSMNLHYSYSPQVNPRTSAVEVRLNNVTISGKRLTSSKGGRETLNVNLPENLIQPTSVLEVAFALTPREPATCGVVTDQQLWGTVHADTTFDLKRQNTVRIPDLKLLQTGFPLTAPQDLSSTAVVLPDAPSDNDVMTLLAFSERMGRLSRAEAVKLGVYLAGSLPVEVRNQKNLVGIGDREQFPIPEVFQANGLRLGGFFTRQRNESQIQTLPDDEGVIKSVLSPWNRDRVLLALTGQTESGLKQVQDIFEQDTLFFQLEGDTALVSANQQNPSPYDPNAYNLEFLQQTQQRRIDHTNLLSRISRVLQDNWFLLPTGIVLIALILYGIAQLYLNRITQSGELK